MAVGVLEFVFILMMIFGRGVWSILPQQDTFCGDLVEADCTVYQQAYDVTNALTSYRFDGITTIIIETQNAEPETIKFTMSNNGVTSGDLSELYSLDPTISLDNAIIILDTYSRALVDAKLDMTLNLHLDEPLSEDGVTDFPLQMRMSDGILYLYSDSPEAAMTNWAGLDYSGISAVYQGLLTSAISSEQVSAEQLAQIEALLQGDYFQLATDPAFMGEYITVTRGDDMEMDGRSLMAISLTVDLNKLYNNEQFIASTRTMVEELVAIDPTIAEEQSVEELVEEMTTGLGNLYGNTIYSVTTWFDPTDLMVYHSEMTIDTTMNSGALFGAEDGSQTTTATETIHYVISTTIDYSNFNQPIEVEVPENADITDITTLFGDF